MSSSPDQRKEATRYLDPAVVSQLNNLELRARLIVEGFITGLHKSPYHGFSVEFAEHRAYNPGENPRNIDWKVYGKTERLYTRRFEEETNLRCHLVLDVSDSMRYPLGQGRVSKLEYSINLAAALGYLMQRQRDAVGLTLYDNEVRQSLPPKTTASTYLRLLQVMEQVLATRETLQHRTATAAVLHQLAQKLPRRSMVVLFSDLLLDDESPEVLFPALQHLRHQNHDILIFQVLDASTELSFQFPDQPLILEDLESNERVSVQPADVRATYLAQSEAYRRTLHTRCRELEIDLVPLDVAQPYTKALTDFIRYRRLAVR